MSDKAKARVERTPWGTISREQVVATAIEEIAEGGYEQLTIRSLAARLGVAPMSLYRHIPRQGRPARRGRRAPARRGVGAQFANRGLAGVGDRSG